jgi:sulfhydrogenase subunit beta (sulfur reductase)
MSGAGPRDGTPVVLDVAGLQALLDALIARGYEVIGPTVRGGAVVPARITSVEDLPSGIGDVQEPGHYRLTATGRAEFFGYAASAISWKPYLFPAQRVVWRAPATDPASPVAPSESAPRQALLGVRACDLSAIQVQDRVFLQRQHVDPDYATRRLGTFIVAVGCANPASTCFCTSMGTGPVPDAGYDISLTELVDAQAHRFVATGGSEPGLDVLAELAARPAQPAELAAAEQVGADAVSVMRESQGVDTLDLRDLLYANAEHPRWSQVAQRCLACSNCTMACPTCFCVTAVDTSDLGAGPARLSVWDSCFAEGHSMLGGRPVRSTTRTRYRQWLTHKFASWIDQFGTSGCVGCGRCITWCPAGIDVREELAAIRTTAGSPDPEEASS